VLTQQERRSSSSLILESMKNIRTLVVDDEPHSAEMLCGYLKEYATNIDVVASASSAEEATELIIKHRPELLFLDISMPGEDGLDLVRKFPNPDFEFVYVTAHQSYAVKAFELGAVHYLLKPIDLVQLSVAVQRVAERIRPADPRGVYSQSPDGKLAVASTSGHQLVNVSEIEYLKSEGSYTDIVLANGNSLTSSKNIGFYEHLLRNYKFYRSHRQYLINLNSVKSFTKGKSGYAELASGASVQISFSRMAGFVDAVENGLMH